MLWRILLTGTWDIFFYASGSATLLLYAGPEVAIDFLYLKINQDVEIL